ncbi:MAG: phosphonate C-P lyase system protein PhnG [Pseudomonadota bacterium]
MTRMPTVPESEARKAWMGLLARAAPCLLRDLLPVDAPPHSLLRPPEVGAVMVRGRIGATGAPFNLGEVTVTRCAVRLATGQVGHAHVQGRDKDHALRSALVDAMMQTEAAPALQRDVLAELARAEQETKTIRAGKAAATRVEFFTMVRGEDQ